MRWHLIIGASIASSMFDVSAIPRARGRPRARRGRLSFSKTVPGAGSKPGDAPFTA